jgi:uncharacterized protein YutE (UPF0331/DUF86 family)
MNPDAISRLVVADKVAAVDRMLQGISTLPLEGLRSFTADPHMVAAGESYLRRALEALLDLGRHVLAKGFGRGPAEYAEVGRQLGEVGVLDAERALRLVQLARYRNRMVHFYDEISPEELYEILTARIADVRGLVQAVIVWVNEHPERIAAAE